MPIILEKCNLRSGKLKTISLKNPDRIFLLRRISAQTEVYTGSALAGFIQKIHNKKIRMCQFCIHYLNNIRVRTQKSHITTLSRLREVASKKQMSNFAKYTIVSDMQFLCPNLFVIK